MTLSKRTLPLLAATALIAALATGCGGDGGRPSVDEISDSIQDNDVAGGEVDSATADCIAEAFHDSDLSDDALQAIVDDDDDYEPSDEDEAAITSLSTGAMTDCITDGLELPELEDPEAS
ncbi:MAG: hypothetical protein WBP61_10565 [Nocardioides sp.]